MFVNISTAYTTLSDARKRAIYDRGGAAAVQASEGTISQEEVCSQTHHKQRTCGDLALLPPLAQPARLSVPLAIPPPGCQGIRATL